MNLPEDVVLEILSRLPVKYVIRFKCVCKSWNALINTPIFISKHYQNVLLSERDPEVLLISRREDASNKRVISLLKNDGDDGRVSLEDQNLPLFLNDMFGHVRLIGPCNGVVCLYGYTDNIALWNPSIRDFKMLPQSLVPRPHGARVRGGDLGMGFDSLTNDLKVMQILFCVTSDCHLTYHVEIYSLRNNVWREYAGAIPANIMYYSLWSMVHKDETFCWWAQDEDNNEVILSFNMGKEVFQKTPLPREIQGLGRQPRITRAILPHNGKRGSSSSSSIALLVYGLKGLDKVFDMWVVGSLDGNDSWEWVARIGPIVSVERPLGFWGGGEELVLESSKGELVVCGIKGQSIKNLGIYGKRNRLEVVGYKESLFPLSKVL